jgi:hypothetical protein
MFLCRIKTSKTAVKRKIVFRRITKIVTTFASIFIINRTPCSILRPHLRAAISTHRLNLFASYSNPKPFVFNLLAANDDAQFGNTNFNF